MMNVMNELKQVLSEEDPIVIQSSDMSSPLEFAESVSTVNVLVNQLSTFTEGMSKKKLNSMYKVYSVKLLDDKVWEMKVDGGVFRQEKTLVMKVSSIINKLSSALTKQTGFFREGTLVDVELLTDNISKMLKKMKKPTEDITIPSIPDYDVSDIVYGGMIDKLKTGKDFIARLDQYVGFVDEKVYHISDQPLRLVGAYTIDSLIEDTDDIDKLIKKVNKQFVNDLNGKDKKNVSSSDAFDIIKDRLTRALSLQMLSGKYIRDQRALPAEYLTSYNNMLRALKFDDSLAKTKILVLYHTRGKQRNIMKKRVKYDIVDLLTKRKFELSKATTRMIRLSQRANIEETKSIIKLKSIIEEDLKICKKYFLKP